MKFWSCVAVGCAVVAVPAATMTAYLLRHPIATGSCRMECHLVIPPWVFQPGGELYVPPGSPVAIPPPNDWVRDWGENTAPWPSVLPPSLPFGDVVVTEEEDTSEDAHHRCRWLKKNYCKHEVVQTPEPSSALGFLAAALMLFGVRHTRKERVNARG